MGAEWTLLHAGALGDLVLTVQLALRLPGVDEATTLRVVSRVNPGDLSACRPSIIRHSSEGLGWHWLYCDEREGILARPGAREDSRTSEELEYADPAPERLRELVRGQRVLSALGDAQSVVHRRLRLLEPAELYSFDPRPQPGVERHITEQWAARLQAQGLALTSPERERGGLLRPISLGRIPVAGAPGSYSDSGRAGARRATPVAHAPGSYARPGTCVPGSDSGRAGTPVVAVCVVIHPGSGGRAKCWPLSCFVEVARRLRDGGSPVVFVVGQVELETWPAEMVETLAEGFDVIRAPEPDELAALLAAATVFVGNDAGPSHLAALLGTPTVTIFGPTSPVVWRPLGSNARVIAGDPEADPQTWGVSADAVVAAVLGAYPQGRPGGG